MGLGEWSNPFPRGFARFRRSGVILMRIIFPCGISIGFPESRPEGTRDAPNSLEVDRDSMRGCGKCDCNFRRSGRRRKRHIAAAGGQSEVHLGSGGTSLHHPVAAARRHGKDCCDSHGANDGRLHGAIPLAYDSDAVASHWCTNVPYARKSRYVPCEFCAVSAHQAATPRFRQRTK